MKNYYTRTWRDTFIIKKGKNNMRFTQDEIISIEKEVSILLKK